MKILQINKFFYLRGGSETHFFELTKLLEAKGHEVIPFCMQDPRNLKSKYDKYFIEAVDLSKFSFKNFIKYFYNYEALKKLEQLIQTEQPDVAHLHNIAHQFSPAIIRLLKKHNIPVIQTLHDYKLICPNYQLYSNNQICLKCKGSKYYNCLTSRCVKKSYLKSFMAMTEAYLNNRVRRLYEQVDLFIAPSKFMKDISVDFGVKPEKIEVVNNFINFDFAKIASESLEPLEKYLLYFGRLSDEKGVRVLVKAMSHVNLDLKLKIVGSGPEKIMLLRQIDALGLSARVSIIDQIPLERRPELEKIIRQATAVVVPSVWYENMPYSLIEAMAMSKLVIVSELGGMVELVKHGETGLLFKAGDSQALAEQINNLTPERSELIGRQAQIFIQKLSPENYYFQILNIYKQFTNEV